MNVTTWTPPLSAVWFLSVGAIFGFLAVALGAFAAHALRKRLSAEQITVFQTGVQYQMYHALGLLVVGSLRLTGMSFSGYIDFAGWAFIIGVILFSGSLYALTLSAIRRLGAITPLGGVAFLLGWASLVIGVIFR